VIWFPQIIFAKIIIIANTPEIIFAYLYTLKSEHNVRSMVSPNQGGDSHGKHLLKDFFNAS
jgi:hypothetical protein